MPRFVTGRALVTGILPALVCFLALGCGDEKTHRVSGKATFKGQPIPDGKIYFMPDESKGNSGPTGYAVIKNGEYDTSDSGGLGVVGGPMIVMIEGGAAAGGKKDESGEEIGVALFPAYETTADLPKEDTTKDFDVPADAVNRKSQPERDAEPGGP